MMANEIRDYKPDDPIPDLFNRFPIGYILKMPDGRKFLRLDTGEWQRLP